MKKLALALVFGVLSVGAVSAQTTPKNKIKTEKKADNKKGGEGKEYQQKTPEQRAEMQAQKMGKEYNLTDDQIMKLKEVNLAKARQMETLRSQGKENREAMGSQMKEIKNNYDNQVKGILTPDQYAKFDKERAERMEKRKGKHGEFKKGAHKGFSQKNETKIKQ